MKDRIPELLAPAGSAEALCAAVEAGADAVYFGASGFNARMRAKNFDDSELLSALKTCAEYGVKTYVTVNTRVRDGEIPDVVSLAERLYLGGASALIVADLGAASAIRERIPGFELHASTQLSGHSSYDAAALSSFGFSRMVCPREMSLDEIEALVASSPIEIEMFIHGAHCVSFSGQCLMSYALGGRSGNRGMCAQPCRLSYSVDGVSSDRPLGMKDMCLAGSIREIIDCGVSSLKIEGRQKSADYVYGVVKIYRRLLDERRSATADEIAELSRLFSRSGFTDGYLKHSYKNMLGARGEDERTPEGVFTGLKRKVALDAALEVKVGERAKLTFTDGERCAVAYGEVTKKREAGCVMSREAAYDKVGRLGATAFTLRNFEFDIDPEASFSLSELNALRREASRRLAFPHDRSEADFESPTARRHADKRRERRLMTAQFASVSQIPDGAAEFFDRIYIPTSDAASADGVKYCLYCPPLTYDVERDALREAILAVGGEVLVNGLGQAALARECGAVPAGSFRFNVTNSVSASELCKYVSSVTLSPEVPSALGRDIGTVCSVIVYGRLPLMHTERCAISDGGAVCPFSGAGGRTFPRAKKRAATCGSKSCDGTLCHATMTDRTGTKFPVVGLPDCSNIILNSVPLYMADRRDFLSSVPADRLHFIFTVESRDECAAVIEAYKNGTAPKDNAVRRIK